MFNQRYHPMKYTLKFLSASLFLLLFLVQSDAYAQKKILFIYNASQSTGETQTNGRVLDEDVLYLTILEDQLGYEAVLVDQNDVSPADAEGVDAVFISETVGSGTVVSNFILPFTGDDARANLDIPIITAEEFIMDDMMWLKHQPTPPYGIDYAWGFARSNSVNILPTDHPILGGLRAGPVTVYDAPGTGEDPNQVGYAVPNGEGQILAAVPGTATFNGEAIGHRFDEMRGSLFVFNEGDMLHDTDTLQIQARARRVAFFAHTHGGENLSEVGQALFANSIAWALGDEDKLQDITADPYTVLFIFNASQSTGETETSGRVLDEDIEYLTILEDELGYDVVTIDQNDVSPADTAGVDLIFISETVGSGTVVANFISPMTGNAQFGNVAKPMVVAEIFVLDDMYWITHQPQPPYGVDHAWGFAAGELIDVQDTFLPDFGTRHAILGGLRAGEIDVYDDPGTGEDSNQIGYAVARGENARIVATLGSDATFNGEPLAEPTFPEPRAVIFTYEAGDSLASSDTLNIAARGRRATFFAHTRGGENMNAVGRDLFTNTILWASGRDSEVRPITATAVEPGAELPTSFAIESLYPNPFNPSTTALLKVQQAGAYELSVYDVLGRLVQTHAINVSTPGQVRVSLEMNNQASGMYVVQVVQKQTGKAAVTRAMLVK